MSEKKKTGRPCKKPRLKLILQRIEEGRIKHIFSVISDCGITDVMKFMQEVRVKQTAPGVKKFCQKCKKRYDHVAGAGYQQDVLNRQIFLCINCARKMTA